MIDDDEIAELGNAIAALVDCATYDRETFTAIRELLAERRRPAVSATSETGATS